MNRNLKSKVPMSGNDKHRSYKKGALDVNDLIQKVDAWAADAMFRENVLKEKVFTSSCVARVVSDICNVSERTVYYARKHNPKRKFKKDGRCSINLDDFDKKALSRLVLGYYRKTPPELPTVQKIYEDSQKLPGFPPIGKSKLYLELKKLGFVYKKRNRKMHVYQRFDITAQRQKYLRKVNHFRSLGYTAFFQDETWCNANHSRECIWQMEHDPKIY